MKIHLVNIFKKLLVCTMVLSSVVSCNNEKYHLRWKIDANQPVYYKLITTSKDDAKLNFEINNEPIDSLEMAKEMLKALSSMNEMEAFIILQKNENEDIDFKWAMHNPNANKKPEDMSLADAMALMMQVVSLEGTIDNSGKLLSDNLQQRQKNLVNIYCQLPPKAVAIGDSWKVDVELIDNLSLYPESEIENYNKVTLEDVKEINGQRIAFIEYDIFQSVETKIKNPFTGKEEENYMSYSFQVKAEFDIVKGKWIKFKETKSTERTGFVESKQEQQIELVRVKKLPEELIKRLSGQSDKMQYYLDLANNLNGKNPKNDDEIIDLEKGTPKDEIIEKDNKSTNVETEKKEEYPVFYDDDCPVNYAVQVLASKKKVPLDNKRFNSIRNEVYEIIKPQEVYKYKYCVGKECSKQKAQLIKKKLLTKGFSGVFIVKVSK